MRQTHLAGPGDMAAADQTGIGYGVMGRAERSGGHQGLSFGQQADNTEYFGGLQRFFKGNRGQDSGQAFSEHGFSGAGGADHQ